MAQIITQDQIEKSLQATIRCERFPRRWRVAITWTGGVRYEYCASFKEAAEFVANFSPPPWASISTIEEEVARGFANATDEQKKNFTRGD